MKPVQFTDFPSQPPPPLFKLPNWAGNTIAGMTQATLVTITGYPFDLVKVKMQAKREIPYRNAIECVKDVYKREGIMGMYRGSAMPWVSHMIKRPTQFPVSEYLKKRCSPKDDDRFKRIRNNYIIGSVSGIFGPIIGTPLQVIKIGMQTTGTGEFSNSWAYAKNEIKMKGISGLYRGFFPTVIKDGIFGGSFVGTYYSLRDYVGTDSWYKNFFNGAAAHCITWYLFIPIDYIKTNVQRASVKNVTVLSVIKDGYRTSGMKIFWKGVVPACLRTIPVSGVAMTGYEFVRKTLVSEDVIENKKD